MYHLMAKGSQDVHITYIQRVLGYQEVHISADEIDTLAEDRCARRNLVTACSAAEGWWWWWWFPCSFWLKKSFKQWQLLLFCVFNRRAYTNNEWLHRITREIDVKLYDFNSHMTIFLNFWWKESPKKKTKFYSKFCFLMPITLNFWDTVQRHPFSRLLTVSELRFHSRAYHELAFQCRRVLIELIMLMGSRLFMLDRW